MIALLPRASAAMVYAPASPEPADVFRSGFDAEGCAGK
jgi:hypothetical protein